MFNNELNQLTEELQYHRNQVEELQNKLEEVKICEAFGSEAIDKVKGAIEQIGVGKYLWLFKEELLSIFPATYASQEVEAEPLSEDRGSKEQPPVYLEEKEEETQQVTVTSVPQEKPEKEFGSLSYYELKGVPDLRPDTFEDLAPNIVYSSSNKAYVGFNDYSKAKEFRDSISEPSRIAEEDTMNGFKYEVRFYCSREYVQEIVDSINSMSEDVQTPNFEKIDGEIIYNHADSICYVAGRAKGRLDNYGSYLTRILDIGDKYTVSNKPTMFDSKYELRIEECSFEDALHLQDFNLLKEYDHSENEEARTLWRESRQRVHPPACRPSDKLVPLEEIKLGDIVYLNSINNQYKVLSKVELDGVPHIEVICVFNSERPSLVSAMSYLKECYLVDSEGIQIDPQFQEEKQEEVLTEDVQIYIPKEKETTVKKPKELSEAERSSLSVFDATDFPASPYKPIKLTKLEFGDIVTSTPHSRSAYMVKEHKGEFVVAECLYHSALKDRVGGDFDFTKPYLVEKATEEVMVA